MKKMFLFGALFAVGLSFTACSSDKDVAEKEPDPFDNNGETYLAINLNLPTQSGSATRADNTYTEDDGSEVEYEVKNGIIAFFQGENSDAQSTATFLKAYDLGTMTPTDVKNNEVTQRWKPTPLKLSKTDIGFSDGKAWYAYVILNNNGYASATSGGVLSIGSSVVAVGTTFSNFMAMDFPVENMADNVITNKGYTKNLGSDKGIMMTNAPLATKKSSSSITVWQEQTGTASTVATTGEIVYLAKITSDNFKATAVEAESNPVEIYVERAAAKVSLTNAVSAVTNGHLDDGTAGSLTFNAVYWFPDNTVKKFTNVRRLSATTVSPSLDTLGVVKTGGSIYRFVGNQVDGKELWRTTWAVDLDYATKPDTYTSKATTPNSTTDFITASADNFAYIPENTMRGDLMRQGYTTRVIICGQIGDGSANYYSTNYLGHNYVYTYAKLQTNILAYIPSATNYVAADMTNRKIVITDNTSNGTATITEIMDDTSNKTSAASHDSYTYDAKFADLLTEIQGVFSGIKCYVGGRCYYKLQIRHFTNGTDGSDKYEVKSPTLTGTSDYASVYNRGTATDYTNDFLGLYGIVRNTWYAINITKFTNTGEPSIPTIPDDTPDDELESHISAKINVMRWAKRTQDREL